MTACATVCVELGWIRKGRKSTDFEQKAWAIAHGFEHGRFCELLEIAPNSVKCLQNRSKMICDCLSDFLCRFRVNSQGSKIGRFWAKGLGYSPWFWTCRFWQVLQMTPNSPKRLQNRSKMICDCLRDFLCRFRGNSRGSKIRWFWAKGLGYSPWFWAYPNLASPGNRSKLSKTPPKPF